ncbi:MAG TPA: amino acid ABC transporter substrate-binding protein [Acidimicrobiia bacterium]|jgi:branched-chain amino acid transport system substrate-binding protein
MTTRWRSTALAAVLVVTGCGGGDGSDTGSSSGEDTLKVGAALSLTGKLAREGALTKEGYQYCEEVVNAKGGVDVGGNRQKLRISYQDDQSIPDTAAQLVDGFNDRGIRVLLGPYGSASTEAAAAVVERNGQVMVEGAGADNKIFAQGYRNLFAVLSPATTYLSSIVRAVTELANPRPAKVAIAFADDGFSRTAAEAGRDEAQRQGMEVVAFEAVPNGATDVSAALVKIKTKSPDLILLSAHLVEGVALVRQAKELGVQPAGGFGETVAPPTPDFVSTLGAAAEGVLGSSQWTRETEGAEERFGTAPDYAAGVAKRFGHEPEYHNAEATAACLALVLAMEKADSTDPAQVRDALAGLDVQTFFGRIRFDEEGKNADKPMAVVQIQDGKAVTVWPRSEHTAPLRWPAG